MAQDHVTPPVREGRAWKGPNPHSLLLVNLLLSQAPSHFDHNFYPPLPCSCIFQQPSSKPPVCMNMFPSSNLVENLEKHYWTATVTVNLCPGCSPAEEGAGPSLWAAVIQSLHKLLSALAHAFNCTHKALEGPQDAFQQRLHNLHLISVGVPTAPVTGPWPKLCESSHDTFLQQMEAGEGSSETEEKKQGKAFSFIYFSKFCNCQMHLPFPEVIILSPFWCDPDVTLGEGSNLFQVLYF